MNKTNIWFANESVMDMVRITPHSAVSLIAERFHELYTLVGMIYLREKGEAAAEEVFDLTNNPNREDERNLIIGDNRSFSVGDVVETAGGLWLCMPMGWRLL